MTDDLTATENAREIALQSARDFMRDRDRWMGVAERLADAMRHASDEGYCTLTTEEHAALAIYHGAKSRGPFDV